MVCHAMLRRWVSCWSYHRFSMGRVVVVGLYQHSPRRRRNPLEVTVPSKPKSVCPHPGCNRLVRGGKCVKHRRTDTDRARDRYRGSASSRGYGATWRRIREQVLAEQPLCAECERRGKLTPATEVDHVTPKVQGGSDARENLQGLCRHHHARKTAAENIERTGGPS